MISPASLQTWQPGPVSPALDLEEAHVWSFSLEPADWEFDLLARTLSDDERARAGRFFFGTDRNHFMVGRGLLRVLLGRYLEIEPRSVQFQYGPHGKPRLGLAQQKNGLQFNLAHSAGRGLFGITRGMEAGIDVERLRSFPDMDAVAGCFFSENEIKKLQALQGIEKEKMFYSFWTCKEAYLKASGEGLIDSLQNLEVQFVEGRGILHFLGSDKARCFAWPTYPLEPLDGYAGAIAAAGPVKRIQCFDWAGPKTDGPPAETADSLFFTETTDCADVHSVS